MLSGHGVLLFREKQVGKVDAGAQRGAHLVAHVGRVHGGQPVLGLSLAHQLERSDVLQKDHHRLDPVEVDGLQFDLEGLFLVHPCYRNLIVVTHCFIDHAHKTHDPLQVLLLTSFFDLILVQADRVFLLPGDADLGNDLEFECGVDVVATLGYPVHNLNLRVLKKDFGVILLENKNSARQ